MKKLVKEFLEKMVTLADLLSGYIGSIAIFFIIILAPAYTLHYFGIISLEQKTIDAALLMVIALGFALIVKGIIWIKNHPERFQGIPILRRGEKG